MIAGRDEVDMAKVSDKAIGAAELRKLKALHEAASSGSWSLRTGGFGNSLWITNWSREREGGDGPIASVSTERTITERDGLGGRSDRTTFRKQEIKTAKADAELIVAAVNALPKLIAALLGPKQVDETAWLIEFPADKYGPIRYWSAGEPPVIDAGHATRFSREEDAKRIISHEKLGHFARATEHAWMPAIASKQAAA